MINSNSFSYCPELRQIITLRQAVGRTGKVFDGVGALSSINNLLTIRNLCLELKPSHTLEVGFCYGGSGLTFAASHRDLGNHPQQQHVALDPFQTSVWDDAGLVAMDRAALTGWLDFRQAFSSVELPSLFHAGRQFDLVYIDGSHLFEDVFVDAYFVSKLLVPGGVVLFDDSTDPHVAKVLRFIRTNYQNVLKTFALEHYRLDKGATLKYWLAKVVGRRQLTAFQKLGDNQRAWNAQFHNF